MVSTSLVRVLTFLVRVLTFLVMVSTSLGMVGTPEALLWGPQRRLLHRRATRDWKSKSVTYLLTDGLTWVGARDTCVSKNIAVWFAISYTDYIFLSQGSEIVGEEEEQEG